MLTPTHCTCAYKLISSVNPSPQDHATICPKCPIVSTICMYVPAYANKSPVAHVMPATLVPCLAPPQFPNHTDFLHLGVPHLSTFVLFLFFCTCLFWREIVGMWPLFFGKLCVLQPKNNKEQHGDGHHHILCCI